jgi:hypothetical protein
LVATSLSPLAAAGRRRNRRGGTAPAPDRRALNLIQGSLSARRVERQSPLLAGLHRVTTGALVGLGLSMLGLSALTIHWQNQWARSYGQLEASKELEHRMQESAALLEQHHLGAVRKPGQLVPTSSEKLIHLPLPQTAQHRASLPLLAGIHLRRIPAGY